MTSKTRVFIPSTDVTHITWLWRWLSAQVVETSVSRKLITGRFWELFCLLTCSLHTTIFMLLSIISPLEIISLKTWETQLSWCAKSSLPVGVRVSKTSRASKLVTKPLYFDRAPFSTEEPPSRLQYISWASHLLWNSKRQITTCQENSLILAFLSL